MGKLKSIVKKIQNVDIPALIEGMNNLKQDGVDEIVKVRAEICKSCKYFEEEPVKSLRVKDKDIPELSGMMCGNCFCELSYKLRVKDEECPLKKW